MLQYDWGSSSNGNPNSQSVVQIIDDTGSYAPDPALTIYHHHDPFNQQQSTHHFNPEPHFIPTVNPLFQTPQNNRHQTATAHHHHHHQHFANPTMYDASQRVYDTRTDGSYPLPLTLEPIGFVKPEPVAAGLEWGIGSSSSASSRLGLNLGGRTFYAEDDFVNRLYRRSRMLEPGSVSAPRCQAEGCNADLSHAKHYHRRHKVCEFHSKASTVIANGLTQRFCQQCSRFHLLPEFDNGKRSCRKRLADHNRRRRKSQQQTNQENNTNKSQLENNNNNSSSENATARSPSDSRAHSSSVTIAISPPRISVDCFGHGSYNNNGASASTSSTSSLFYSNG